MAVATHKSHDALRHPYWHAETKAFGPVPDRAPVKNSSSPVGVAVDTDSSPEYKSSRAARFWLQSLNKKLLEANKGEVNGIKRVYNSSFRKFGACCQLSSDAAAIYRSPDAATRVDLSQMSLASIKGRSEGQDYKAQLAGVVKCNNVWLCPVCSQVIMERRSKEIEHALRQHTASGGYVLFVTFTIRHQKVDELEHVKGAMQKALTRTFDGGGWWRGLKKDMGFIGKIRTWEYKYTESNGHHPHVHELWFLKERPNIKELKRHIFKRYKAMVEQIDGLLAPTAKRGLLIELAVSNEQRKKILESEFDEGASCDDLAQLAGYMTKSFDADPEARSWGAADEMVRGHAKTGASKTDRRGNKIISYSPFGLAMEYYKAEQVLKRNPGDKQAGKRMVRFKALFVGYAGVFSQKGSHQVRWSNGLKDHFNIEDFNNDELSKIDEIESELLLTLNINDLRAISKFRLRATVIQMTEDDKGDVVRVRALLERYLAYFSGEGGAVERFDYG